MILYLHGLESSPHGRKGRYLQDNYGAHAVDLDTSQAIACRNECLKNNERWTLNDPAIELAFFTPMARAAEAIDSDTRLIIGSSFGGAVLMKLIHSGKWRGPSLFICPAAYKLTPHRSLPGGFPSIILHGHRDDLIPISDSRRLAESGGLETMLWEVDDGHRMSSIVETGVLAKAIEWLLSSEALATARKAEKD